MNLSDEVDLYIRGLDTSKGKPSATDIASFKVLCERTGLSPIARQIYLVCRGGKWTAQTSIDGFRSIAARSVEYAGQDGPYWVSEPGGQWTDVPPEGQPYAAKVGVRLHIGDTFQVTYATAKFKDYNAGGGMWSKFAATMIAKCAEALALRKALPAAMAGLYTAEEMAQAGDKAPPVVIPASYEQVEAEIARAVQTKDTTVLKAAVALAGRLSDEEQTRAAAAIREAAASIRAVG